MPCADKSSTNQPTNQPTTNLLPPQNTHTHTLRYNLAVDLSLAALTGDGVFNFGEVLATPLLAVLQQTPHAWLSELLQVRACVRACVRGWVGGRGE
jgi:hypothetical protein